MNKEKTIIVPESEYHALKERVEYIADELAELKSIVLGEVENVDHHIHSIYQFIRDIHDYLMPVVRKVFPGYNAARKQLDEFIKKDLPRGKNRSS